MQSIEKEYDFIENGILSIYQDYDSLEYIDYIIKQLESADGPKLIHTINFHTVHLCENICNALKVFVDGPNIVTNIFLEDYALGKNSSTIIKSIINILELFKNVTDVKLSLRYVEYTLSDIAMLRRYFDNATNIKVLQLRYRGMKILDLVESIKSNDSIENLSVVIDPGDTCTTKSIEYIAKLLVDNNTIRKFYLESYNILSHESLKDVKSMLEKTLVDNYIIIDFNACFQVGWALISKVDVKLQDITDRNKIIFDNLRFAKQKAVTY